MIRKHHPMRLASILLPLLCLQSALAQCPPADTVMVASGAFAYLGSPSPDMPLSCAPCVTAVGGHYSIDVTSQSVFNKIKAGANMSVARYTILDSTCTYALADTCGEWDATANVWLEDSLRTGRRFRVNIVTEGTGPTIGVGLHVAPALSGRIAHDVLCGYMSVGTEVIGPIEGDIHPIYRQFNTFYIFEKWPLDAGIYYETWPSMPSRKGRIIRVLE